jgi:hypothetical protein
MARTIVEEILSSKISREHLVRFLNFKTNFQLVCFSVGLYSDKYVRFGNLITSSAHVCDVTCKRAPWFWKADLNILHYLFEILMHLYTVLVKCLDLVTVNEYLWLPFFLCNCYSGLYYNLK